MVLAMAGMISRSRRLGVAALSYAAPEDTRSKQAVIRLVERLSGQARVERIYRQVRANLRPEDDVWAQAMRGLHHRSA